LPRCFVPVGWMPEKMITRAAGYREGTLRPGED